MNIVNNYQLYNTSFKANKGTNLNSNRDINDLTGELCEALVKKAEKEVPENGKFGGVAVAYYVPNTQNIGKCIIKYDPLEPKNSRRLYVGANREGSDRLISVNILKGTKKEILDYLSNKDNQKEVTKKILELSKEVDEYYE